MSTDRGWGGGEGEHKGLILALMVVRPLLAQWMDRLCDSLDYFLSQAYHLISNRHLPQSSFYWAHCLEHTAWTCQKWGIKTFSWHVSLDIEQYDILLGGAYSVWYLKKSTENKVNSHYFFYLKFNFTIGQKQGRTGSHCSLLTVMHHPFISNGGVNGTNASEWTCCPVGNQATELSS